MRVQGINQNYQMNRVQGQKAKATKQNQNFGAKLAMDADMIEDIAKSERFTHLVLGFRDWLKTQKPYDGVYVMQKKQGEMVPQLTGYSNPHYGKPQLCVEYMRENLEFSMGNAKTGFCLNEKNSDKQIIKDLKSTYEKISHLANV